jgi:transposase
MMKLTELHYERIRDTLPRQRGNVRQQNLDVLNAILYIAENGCKWRALPKEFGNWNTIYVRLNRWAKSGVLDRVFEALQKERLLRMKIEVASLDSTIVKVHPDGTGALKKLVHNLSANPEEDGQPKFIWLPRTRTPR